MKIFLAGHNGMVGGAIFRQLKAKIQAGEEIEVVTRSRSELDLTRQESVSDFMNDERPDQVVLAAAKVGGIAANNEYPAEFIYENIAIQSNVIHSAFKVGVGKLLQLGSSCIYPKLASQPISESALLNGWLEPTNEPYAIAKIAGIKLCESYNRQYGTDFRSIMPTNLYGPGDNFHSKNSHVIPALICRFHEAVQSGQKAVSVWGSGKPKREFLHVDDMARAALFLLDLDKNILDSHVGEMQSHINIGTGQDISIEELAKTIAKVVGFSGEIKFDSSFPDGTPRKLLDVSLAKSLGWTASIPLQDGLKETYQWYLDSSEIRK